MTTSSKLSSVHALENRLALERRETLGFVGLLAVAIVLLLVRQPDVPWPWFDEGLNMSTAATIARDGLYALPDAQGFRVFDPAIQTGPTVIVPIALIYKLFGVSVFGARAVVLTFAIIALIAYWLLARRLVGRAESLLATVMLLAGTAVPSTSFLATGRQVLGEVPAFAFLLLGAMIWLRAVERQASAPTAYLFAGLAWGLAMVTKSQVLITLPFAVGLLALADRLYYRQARWGQFIIPMITAAGCIAFWYGAQIAIGGYELFQRNTVLLREGSRIHVLGIEPAHWRNAVSSCWRTGFWLWGSIALVWGCWQARSRSFDGLQHAAILSLALTMLLWFIALSIGWERYLFFPLMLAPIWLAGCLLELARGRMRFASLQAGPALAAVLCTLLVLANARGIATTLLLPDSGYGQMRQFLAEKLPPGSTVATSEWELGIDNRYRFDFPSTETINQYTIYIQSRRGSPPELAAHSQHTPDYVLTGAFHAFTGVYESQIAQGGELIASYGIYRLYRLQTPAK